MYQQIPLPLPLNFSEQTNSRHIVPQFLKDARTYVWEKGKRTCVLLGIGEGNSECTARCCQCHQSLETKGHMYGQKPCPSSYWSVVNVIKVWRQKDICMGKSQTDMCRFIYWRAREGNSECTGKFHQSPETRKKQKKRVKDALKGGLRRQQ